MSHSTTQKWSKDEKNLAAGFWDKSGFFPLSFHLNSEHGTARAEGSSRMLYSGKWERRRTNLKMEAWWSVHKGQEGRKRAL